MTEPDIIADIYASREAAERAQVEPEPDTALRQLATIIAGGFVVTILAMAWLA